MRFTKMLFVLVAVLGLSACWDLSASRQPTDEEKILIALGNLEENVKSGQVTAVDSQAATLLNSARWWLTSNNPASVIEKHVKLIDTVHLKKAKQAARYRRAMILTDSLSRGLVGDTALVRKYAYQIQADWVDSDENSDKLSPPEWFKEAEKALTEKEINRMIALAVAKKK